MAGVNQHGSGDGAAEDVIFNYWKPTLTLNLVDVHQQFKRTTLPPGPKVGTVSLSPRGDWRMPDEAELGTYLATVDALPHT